MHLRSGRTIGSFTGLGAASRVPTQGSETRSTGQLETIREDTSSESSFDYISLSNSEMWMGQSAREPDVGSSPSKDMHAQGNTTVEQPPSNPFVERTMGLQYNMALTYVTLNEQNARIYVDPFERYVVKIADVDTPFNPNPWVNYQGDSYMGQLGERYVSSPWIQRM